MILNLSVRGAKGLKLALRSVKVGGVCIPQSLAQLRYIGRAHSLYGNTNLEATMIDAFLDGLNDLSMKLRSALIAVSSKFSYLRLRLGFGMIKQAYVLLRLNKPVAPCSLQQRRKKLRQPFGLRTLTLQAKLK